MTRLLLIMLFLPLNSCISLSSMSVDAIGEVKAAEGVPRILRGTRYLEIGQGTDVFVQDVIVTGSADRVQLNMTDGTRITLGHDSEFAFHVYSYEQPRPLARMSLSYGVIRIDIGRFNRRAEHTFEVSTPAGEIDIEGDVWAALPVSASRLDAVLLNGDGLSVHNPLGVTDVRASRAGVSVELGRPPQAIGFWPQDDLRRALNATQF